MLSLYKSRYVKPICTGVIGAAAFALTSMSSFAATPKPLGLPSQESFPNSLADLIEHVSTAVVNIKVVTGGAAAGRPTEDATEGQGSGFIVTSDGKVVTNYHVIEGGDKITVDFANGEEFAAKLVGTDQETDLAVLQIQTDRTFDYVEFYHGDKVRVGDWVLAIGNPFGIGQSSSVGIISAIGRERVESGSFVDYMQTDATVNRGNSGGPLFNFEGKVIGVNSAIYSPTGASVGIAFVIPHYLAENVASDIINYGKVSRGFLGASLRDAIKDKGGIVFRRGATINTLGVGGPADRAGLKVDDIILRVNDVAVRNAIQATRAFAFIKPGQTARLQIERDDEILPSEILVRITERPTGKENVKRATGNTAGNAATSVSTAPSPNAASMQNTGLSLVDLSATFRETIGMRADQVGVYVEAVAPGSTAARKGIKAGMVILQADGKPVASVRTFRQIISSAKRASRQTVTLLVRNTYGSENFTSLALN